MNDPHVVALNYRIEYHSSVDYDEANPLDHSEDGFEIHVEHNKVRFAMKRHYATKSEALEAVEGYILAWEHLAALQYGPNEFKLLFDGAEIEDRDPTPGVVHASAKLLHEHISLSEAVSVHVSRGSYPQPPSTRMEFSRDVKLMFDRYVGYRSRRGYLADLANFCLTILEKSVQHGNGRRKAAAKHYNIQHKVLREIGRLCSEKGGAEARKAQGVDQDLSGQERQFLEEAVKAIIRRAAEVAAEPNGSRDTILLSDLPDFQQSPQ